MISLIDITKASYHFFSQIQSRVHLVFIHYIHLYSLQHSSDIKCMFQPKDKYFSTNKNIITKYKSDCNAFMNAAHKTYSHLFLQLQNASITTNTNYMFYCLWLPLFSSPNPAKINRISNRTTVAVDSYELNIII